MRWGPIGRGGGERREAGVTFCCWAGGEEDSGIPFGRKGMGEPFPLGANWDGAERGVFVG